MEDDYEIQDTYPAQFASALRAGWADPEMADYDNYDEAFRVRLIDCVDLGLPAPSPRFGGGVKPSRSH